MVPPNIRSRRSVQAPKELSKSASCHGTSKIDPNRQLKKKNPKQNMLIFEEGGILDGTEVVYYHKGQALRKGYKAGSNILCYHCCRRISPTDFEGHAGRQSSRKPYNYIKLENGFSLLKVALYLREKDSVVDNGKSSADGEKGLLCDGCRSFFHKDSASLPMNTPSKWQCGFCGREYIEKNYNASEAGRVAEVHPIIKTDECTTCVVGENKEVKIVCALCSDYKYCDCEFGPLAIVDCAQCEKQFHVRCLKEHGKSDLKAKPRGKWFCSLDSDSECEKIYLTLQSFIEDGGENFMKNIGNKLMDSSNISTKDVGWRLLCAKSTYSDDKLLSEATSIFYESFGEVDNTEPKEDLLCLRHLIRAMVYGEKGQNGRMYCAVVTVRSTVVAAGLFRVLGKDLAELPLAATAKAKRRKGYFRLLILYLEELLALLNVRSFVLPATKDSKPMWEKNFAFQEMSAQQRKIYEENCWNMIHFEDAFMLHKVITKESSEDMKN